MSEDVQKFISRDEKRKSRGSFLRWLLSGGRLDRDQSDEPVHPWYLVIWLTGVDYFSTLGYQPGIALIAAGAVSPLATAVLVLVTLFGALPVYCEVAKRSYAGQGSIAMLQNLLGGWLSKVFVLVLLGFGATDFVITMTLSASDAARHAVENPFIGPFVGNSPLLLTLGLLGLLAIVFIMGFKEAIGVAGAVAVPYLLLNSVVVVRGALEIVNRPELIGRWHLDLLRHGDWTMLLLASGILFPKLALGLSGFETGVSVMPLIKGDDPKEPGKPPAGRIRNTRKLLTSAAIIMGALLVASSFVTTFLIPQVAYREGGPASGRALAYLAHRLLGTGFGTIYDLSSIIILWFAGASAMAGLLNLIPRYLPRYGMAPKWVVYHRPLVVLLFAIDVVVTIVFRANVEAQGGAYATGVLALILSAAIAVSIALWLEWKRSKSHKTSRLATFIYFSVVSLVFLYTFAANVVERTDGIIIASIFIVLIILTSAVSRYRRATELRVEEVGFIDDESRELWQTITRKKVNMVPIRSADADSRVRKAAEIRSNHNVSGPIIFVTVHLIDNRSEFMSPIRVKLLRKEGDDYMMSVYRATAIANTLAFISEMIDPIAIYIQLTRKNLMAQSLRYLLWGEGEVGLSVYSILVRYWASTPEDDVRPRIVLTSN